MIFAKIENDICVNAIVFNSNEEAIAFDETLVELPEGYSIGDKYINGVWHKKEQSQKDKIKAIKMELTKLDNTINRATEDLYVLTNTTPYTTIQEVINKKEELRKELQELTKVGE